VLGFRIGSFGGYVLGRVTCDVGMLGDSGLRGEMLSFFVASK
jgi:hypothetical protein